MTIPRAGSKITGLGVQRMGSIGVPELILIFVILLLIFGGKKIPELARGLGAGIRNFKDALHGQAEGEGEKREKQKP